jgi:diacylglycerol kinase (CTP)
MIKALADIHPERKLTHVFGILLMVVVHHFSSYQVTWYILLAAAAPLITFDLLRQKNEYLKKLSAHWFGAIMRRRELHGLTGTTYLLLGTIFILAVFPHNIVALSLLFLALGDPAASLVGLKLGSVKLVGKKTLEGSLAAYLVCSLVAYVFYRMHALMLDHIYVISLLSGGVGALSEILPLFNLDDNFVQPVVNAILLYGLFYVYGGL